MWAAETMTKADKSSLIRMAIDHFKNKLEREQLQKSADLYSEIYCENDDLKNLAETAIKGWPT